jgi:poly(hydroxyalkanoate) depolymerase family esterase
MKKGMAEATRLTRAGSLAEATAVIQRTLRGFFHSDAHDAGRGSAAEPSEPIDAAYRIVQDKPSSTDTSMRSTVPVNDKPARPAGPAMGHPARHLPGSWETPESRRSPTKHKHEVTPEAPPPSVRARGQFIDGAFTNAAGTRTYKLYIPNTYAGQALPLVVMLHGCTQSATDFAAGTRMNGLAERDEFFVVYPEQSQSANGSKCWNWFEPVNQQRDAGEPSLIAGITHKIMSVHHVNADRIYVVGMSAGGAMAAIMAAAYPDLYAAVGVHSGLAYGAAHDLPSGFKAMKKGPTRHNRPLTRAIPLIMFHGDRDTTVARVNADHLRDQWLRGIEGGVGPANGVTIDRGQVVGGHAYTRFTHHGTDGRVILEEWIIHHAGHAWAGGSSNGSFTDPKGPDASAEMLRFFSERSRSN